MKTITKRIAESFQAGKPLAISNTHTDGKSVWLFGNQIATKRDGKVHVTLAGWVTATTVERVNGILRIIGSTASFSRTKGKAMLWRGLDKSEVNPSQWIEA